MTEARTLSNRLARLAAVAHLPRRSRNKVRVRRALIVAGKPLTTTELARSIYRTTHLQHWHTYSNSPSCGEGGSSRWPSALARLTRHLGASRWGIRWGMPIRSPLDAVFLSVCDRIA